MPNSNAYDVHCILFESLLYTRWGLYLLWRVSHHCRVTSLSGFVQNFLSFIFCPCPQNPSVPGKMCWLMTPSGSHVVPEHTPSYLHTEEWVCHMALSWLIFLSKCRSELKRCKPDLEPGHCMVKLVMPSTRASRLKEGGHHSHCKCCMFIWHFFPVVKSLITTKSSYYDNSLTDGITIIEEGSLFLVDTYMQCGLVAALEATRLVRCFRGIWVSHSVETREDEEAIN